MIFFTSDLHIYHNNVIRYCNRPFKDIEEMNYKLVQNWNNVVKPEDTVYNMGDFSLAFRPVEVFSHQLNGIKKLCPGNHDFCHSYHKKSRNIDNMNKWISKYEEYGWEVLPEQTTLEIPGEMTFNLCHHPYRLADMYEDKYKDWRPKDDGKWLLCGHIHQHFKVKENMINVGVDVWDYTPVSLDTILKTIKDSYGK